jgi:hypothetical protein
MTDTRYGDTWDSIYETLNTVADCHVKHPSLIVDAMATATARVAQSLAELGPHPSLCKDMILRSHAIATCSPDCFGILWILQQVGKAACMEYEYPPFYAQDGWEYAEKAEARGLGTIVTASASNGAIACYQEGKYHTGWMELITQADEARYTTVSCFQTEDGAISFESHTRGWCAMRPMRTHAPTPGQEPQDKHFPESYHSGVGQFNSAKVWLRTLVPLERLYNEASNLYPKKRDKARYV